MIWNENYMNSLGNLPKEVQEEIRNMGNKTRVVPNQTSSLLHTCKTGAIKAAHKVIGAVKNWIERISPGSRK